MSSRLPLLLTGIAVLAGAAVWLLSGTPHAAETPHAPDPPSAVAVTPADEVRTRREPVDAPRVEETKDPESAAAETWEIVALGRGDRPIEGVTVRLRDEEDARGETDADGRIVLRMPAGTRSAEASFDGVVSTERYRTISGPRTVVRFDDALPLEVRVVDARTGLPLTGAKVSLSRLYAKPFPLASDGQVHRLESSPASIGVSNWFSEDFDVTAPDGFALAGEDFPCRMGTLVAGGAKLARVTIPVWPSGSVTVRVLDATRVPATGPVSIELVLAGGRSAIRHVELDAEGSAVLDRVAVVPDATLEVIASTDDRTAPRVTLTLRGGTNAYEVTAVLPVKSDSVGAGCGGSSGSGGIGYSARTSGTASLELRVLRHDGSPAPRALLCVSGMQWAPEPGSANGSSVGTRWREFIRSDANGAARLDGIPTDAPPGGSRGVFGAVTVELRDPGLVPTEREFELATAGRTFGELREAEGLAIEVLVEDQEARPVPWVRVSATRRARSNDWTCASLDGDVQDLCPQTGLDGRHTFRGLPEGPIEIQAEFGSHRAKGTFMAGEPARLTLAR